MATLPMQGRFGLWTILIHKEIPSLTLQVLQSTVSDAFTASSLGGLRAKQRKRSPDLRPPDGELNQRSICSEGGGANYKYLQD